MLVWDLAIGAAIAGVVVTVRVVGWLVGWWPEILP